MSINRLSNSTLKFTSKSWGIKFLTKKEKSNETIKQPKLTKSGLNKKRFEILIKKLSEKPEENIIENLFEKFNTLDFEKKQSIRKSLKRKKNEISLSQLIEMLDARIES
jgi:hypothetical protein